MADRLDDRNDERRRRDAMKRDEREMDKLADQPVDGETVGGVSGLAAGAAIGAVAGGPVGAVVGAATGALAGVGVAKGVEALVKEEDEYWSQHYASRPYAAADRSYDYYRPAYRYGWEQRLANPRNRTYEEVETELERGWDGYRAESKSELRWSDARHAARDAWHSIERRLPGDADRDGR